MRALVTGWFSFEGMGATAGDLLSRDVVGSWLERLKCPYDVALAAPFEGGIDLAVVDPNLYSHLVFVCGPFGRSPEIAQFLEPFGHCKRIGVNLTMLEGLDVWNPLHLLLERDSSRTARPDLSLLSEAPRAPIVGIVLIDSQPEYGSKNVQHSANETILRFVETREMAAVRIDTRLDCNSTGLRTPSEIESLIGRMDVVLTTRMHGLVLSLKGGVPVVAIDPVSGGAKVRRQAETLHWPCVLSAEEVTDEKLRLAFDYCLTDAARQAARECRERARTLLADTEGAFRSAFAVATSPAAP